MLCRGAHSGLSLSLTNVIEMGGGLGALCGVIGTTGGIRCSTISYYPGPFDYTQGWAVGLPGESYSRLAITAISQSPWVCTIPSS